MVIMIITICNNKNSNTINNSSYVHNFVTYFALNINHSEGFHLLPLYF